MFKNGPCGGFEFVGGVETVDSLADFINGLIPVRGAGNEEIGFCTTAAGSYISAKSRYVAASDAVKSAFETSDDATVAAARARYVIWAGNYGDSTPFSDDVTLSKVSLGLTNETVLPMMIALFASSIAFCALIALKKKKLHK